MIVPASCIPWIKLQRSGYKDNQTEYAADMEKEYNLMSKYLPEKCNSILDIGCGIGGIDVLLSKYYNNPKLYLLDSNFRSSDIHYGYTNKESYYNSFLATRDMMVANGIFNYHILNLNTEITEVRHVNIIISLLSCGYHYPVETYLEDIKNTLTYDGILILDIRENTDGIEKVKKYFPKIDIISTYNKSTRICARRH